MADLAKVSGLPPVILVSNLLPRFKTRSEFCTAKFAALEENTAVLKSFTPELQAGIVHAFVNSFHVVFLTAVPITVIGFFIAFMLRETPLRTGAGHQAAKEEAAGEALGK